MVTDQMRAEFAARLNEALDDAGIPVKGRGRQKRVGSMFSVSQKGARKWLEGEAIPNTTRLNEIAGTLDINSEWLLSGRGSKRDSESLQEETSVGQDLTNVRYYPEIAASAGHGCLPISEATVLLMRVASSVLERRGVKPENAALLQADGDSMRGTVGHGDMMLLNLADNEPRDGRVYVVSVGEDVLVKRVQRIPNGIKLIADNPAYDSIAVMNEDQDSQVSIVGRVVIAWRAHDLIE